MDRDELIPRAEAEIARLERELMAARECATIGYLREILTACDRGRSPRSQAQIQVNRAMRHVPFVLSSRKSLAAKWAAVRRILDDGTLPEVVQGVPTIVREIIAGLGADLTNLTDSDASGGAP